jgi:hypothetical protein
MNKHKYFVFTAIMTAMMLLFLGNWVIPVQANNTGIGTPTPTGIPITVPGIPGEVASAEQQEKLKSIIQSYFEIRYRALSVAQSDNFKQNGFGDIVSDTTDAKNFLREELGKLAVDIKHAELDHLRYVDYKYFLDFHSIAFDSATQTATILVSESNEVIYEISVESDPEEPIVSHVAGIEHTIVLSKQQNRWKIVSDDYNDDSWKMLRKEGKSTDKILNAIDKMLRTMKAAPRPALGTKSVGPTLAYDVPYDASSHPYDRAGAVEYALQHWRADAGQYNPNYPVYTNDDCTNFISQAIYEGGNASMFIPSPLPSPTTDGRSGWYIFFNNLQRAAAWNDVGAFYTFVTNSEYSWKDSYVGGEYYGEGPEGKEIPYLNDIELGDVIQYDWNDDGIYDHAAIVVDFGADGTPFVAAHTTDYDRVPYTLPNWNKMRFIHIERSNGYPPVKSEMSLDTVMAGTTSGADDAGGNPANPCPITNSDDGNNYFGSCFNGSNITSGFRFTNVQIPEGAHIKYAYVTFTVDGLYGVDPNGQNYYPIALLISGENSTSPSDFSEIAPASRQTSGPSIPWLIDGTVNGSAYDTWGWRDKRTTPDLKSIIQHIVKDIPDWKYGNALSLIFNNDPSKNYTGGLNHHRRVLALDGILDNPDFWRNRWSARLIVAYSLDGTGQSYPPTVYSVTRDPAYASPTNASSVKFIVKFSEAVTGVDNTTPFSDFALTTTGISGAAITDVGGSGDTYTVTVNTGTGDGKIRLDVRDNGTIADMENPPQPLNGGFTTGESYIIDKSAPYAGIVLSTNPTTTNAASVNFLVVFNEPVVGVDTDGPTFDDFTLQTFGVTDASITSVTRLSGTQYQVTVNTGSGSGTISLILGHNGVIRDYASNPLSGDYPSASYTIDKTTVQSSSPESTNPTHATSVNFTVVFSKPVTGVDASDFALTVTGISGVTIAGVSGSGTTYTVTVNTGSGDGTIRLDVLNDGTIIDDLSVPLSSGFTAGEVSTVDKTAPTVLSITRASMNPTNASSVDFTVTFSQPVTGVDISDFALATAISGTTVINVSGSGDTYTVTVDTGSDDGSIRLDIPVSATITDLASNPLAGLPCTVSETYTIDKTAPTVVSITRASPNPTNAVSVDFTVLFSESVTGVDTGDFSLTTSGVSGAAVSGVSGSGDTYTVTVDTGSGDGTIRLDVPVTATITDLAGNSLGNLPFTNGETYNIDKTAPTVLSITRGSANPTNAASVNFTVTFSESVMDVNASDFALTTIGVSGATITNVSGSDNTFTVTVSTGSGDGTIRLDVSALANIIDLAGNPLSGLPFTSGETYTIDKTAPTVLSIVRASPNPTNASSVNFTVTFSESVTGVDIYDFFLTTTGVVWANIPSNGVNDSGSVYTVSVSTGSGSGTIRLDVGTNGTIKDSANNSLVSGFTGGDIYNIDKTPPTVLSITRASTNPTSAAYVSFTVTFSEPVTGVDASDFTLSTTGLYGATITSVSGSGTTYTVVVYTGHGTGLLRLNVIDNDSIMDEVGNKLGGTGTGNGNYSYGEIYTVFR